MELNHELISKSKKIWKHEPVFVFTIDVDWASEDAIKYCFNIFNKFKIPVTFFLTHSSDFLYSQISNGIIDAGIHPNFDINSSHGNSYSEVIDYCINLLPSAKSFRSHRYYDVNDITEKLYNIGIRYDSNICTFLQKVDPFIHRSALLRFPVYFEDGAYLLHNQNLNFNQVKEKLFCLPGLMIFDIHPMHMVLNSPDFLYARKIKDSLSRLEWNSLVEKDLKKLEYSGKGIRNFIIELLEFICENNFKTYNLKQIYEKIKYYN